VTNFIETPVHDASTDSNVSPQNTSVSPLWK